MNAALVGLCMMLGIAVSAWLGYRCDDTKKTGCWWNYATLVLLLAFGMFAFVMLTRVTVLGMNAATVGALLVCAVSQVNMVCFGLTTPCKVASGATGLALMAFVFAMLARVTV